MSPRYSQILFDIGAVAASSLSRTDTSKHSSQTTGQRKSELAVYLYILLFGAKNKIKQHVKFNSNLIFISSLTK